MLQSYIEQREVNNMKNFFRGTSSQIGTEEDKSPACVNANIIVFPDYFVDVINDLCHVIMIESFVVRRHHGKPRMLSVVELRRQKFKTGFRACGTRKVSVHHSE